MIKVQLPPKPFKNKSKTTLPFPKKSCVLTSHQPPHGGRRLSSLSEPFQLINSVLFVELKKKARTSMKNHMIHFSEINLIPEVLRSRNNIVFVWKI